MHQRISVFVTAALVALVAAPIGTATAAPVALVCGKGREFSSELLTRGPISTTSNNPTDRSVAGFTFDPDVKASLPEIGSVSILSLDSSASGRRYLLTHLSTNTTSILDVALVAGKAQFLGLSSCTIRRAVNGLSTVPWQLASGFHPTLKTKIVRVQLEDPFCGGGRDIQRRLSYSFERSASKLGVLVTLKPPAVTNEAQPCIGNLPITVELTLKAPLGKRRLVDAGAYPLAD
jgi:hypothetical protein